MKDNINSTKLEIDHDDEAHIDKARKDLKYKSV